MKHFELLFFDSLNTNVLMRAYMAHDDHRALKEAKRLSSTHAIEVWEGGRMVARVKKANSTFTPEDRFEG